MQPFPRIAQAKHWSDSATACCVVALIGRVSVLTGRSARALLLCPLVVQHHARHIQPRHLTPTVKRWRPASKGWLMAHVLSPPSCRNHKRPGYAARRCTCVFFFSSSFLRTDFSCFDSLLVKHDSCYTKQNIQKDNVQEGIIQKEKMSKRQRSKDMMCKKLQKQERCIKFMPCTAGRGSL